MTTKAMVSIIGAAAIVGAMAGAGVARGPGASGTCESAAARGCPMMGLPVTSPRPATPDDIGSSPEPPRQAQPGVGSAERGRRIYLERCTACHSADPGRNGPVGPAVKGAATELIRARVLQAAYPPGYVPKRPTRIMPPQPDLAPWIVDLAAFLRTR